MLMKPFLLKELDMATDTVSLFESIADLPGGILLDSGMIADGLARYTFMSADPFMVVTSRGSRVRIERRHGPGAGSVETREGNPLDILGGLFKQYRVDGAGAPVPFFGGAAGYFAYDLGRQLEKLPDLAADDVGVPDCWIGFYDVVAALDWVGRKVYLTSTGHPGTGTADISARALERLEWLEKKLVRGGKGPRAAAAGPDTPEEAGERDGSGLTSVFDRETYCEAVDRAREYIAAGDIFQVNLSQRFSLPRKDDPWEVYKRLRGVNPAPMAAYIDCGGLQVVSASPERFMKVAGGLVETRPIKGTRPRGKTPEEDRRWRDELWNSEKDRAELVMIVDLERNDLGRVCVPGSVRVPELYRLEEYPTVFHLVSTVEGRLEEGKDVFDLLKASFPGGSITGAPKIRAMEIIEELEPVRRGIYCGSIGYLAFSGDADLNIVIRTLVFTGDRIYFQVGGGITIDSDPEAEYMETLDKAKALVRALGLDLRHRD
ncbi:MAG: aminodeoxychorismate synthase component I [Peptococcaceae bacterium]|nr:aminodeoxychorismate synthase component I [Peptococcaceae bacterium]